jgi:NAD(P)-dependent dehydrogenase (short-subunit alcohol dehydrogenase family)
MSTVIITGANGNLGLVVTQHLLSSGYRVIAISGPGGAGFMPDHSSLITVEADLGDEQQTAALVTSLAEQYPDIRAAVLLVGGFAMGSLQQTSDAALEEMIRLNYYTAYHMVRPLFSFFEASKEGGKFILIGSRPALFHWEGTAFFAYSLSKAMVVSLAGFINAEGANKNITASVIVPATIDTPANRKAMPQADFTRWVPPVHIAESIAFCLSEAGKHLQENILVIGRPL